MGQAPRQGDLFPEVGAPEGVTFINARCLTRTQDGHRVVIVAGVIIAQYTLGDRMAEAYAMVSLIDQGWATQTEVARAFGHSTRSVRRYHQRFEDDGLSALGRGRGYPKGHPRLPVSRTRQVTRLKGCGISNCQIATRMGVTEKAIRNILHRIGWTQSERAEMALPLECESACHNVSASSLAGHAPLSPPAMLTSDSKLSAFSSDDLPLVPSMDLDPSDRRFDRLMAYLGLLDDAAPIFRSGTAIPGAGVLLAMPALVASGVIECAHEVYGSIGPAFFGLRTTIVALVLMALLRIKRPEYLKEHPPDTLGRILGLDRAPEVKTLRRKLKRLAEFGRSTRFGRALAEHRVAARGAMMGFLYVDGHVRVYHGKETIPKTHVARMRISMSATTDYWVNDAIGEPIFVITAEANAGLVKMLPAILDEARSLLGERRLTVVFDRGGWSPKLFAKLVADGFDLLTYRKGHTHHLPKSRFREHKGVINDRTIKYILADQGIYLLGGKLRLRQVTRLSENGHQTPIVTSRRDLPAVEVAYRMFERWRQENFFKYLREEYALDALVEYATEPDNPARQVPNPKWNILDGELRQARSALKLLPAEYGLKALHNPESRRPTMRGFKIAHGKLGKKIIEAAKHCRKLEIQRATIPRRLSVGQVVPEPVVKLATERVHLTSLLKMVAYQVESDIFRLIAPHYKRVDDEGRTLVQSALASAADIEVSKTELRVLVAPLSSPHRTRVLAMLCGELNATATTFPGTNFILRYEVAEVRKR
ncbi:MAG: helix-turn-helix domain-containing protein [Verrucomicrobia bacterium]|nr:helix-turn-helix domain-containing protein [Verrucomicrobiota bacterium]